MTEIQKKLAELVAARKTVQAAQDELRKAEAQMREVAKEFCNAAADRQANGDTLFVCGDTAVVLREKWYELTEPLQFLPVVDCSQEAPGYVLAHDGVYLTTGGDIVNLEEAKRFDRPEDAQAWLDSVYQQIKPGNIPHDDWLVMDLAAIYGDSRND